MKGFAVVGAGLVLLASCDEANTKRQSAATAWERTETVYFHHGVAAGPVLTTNADGTLREERRYDPFGQPVDANLGGTIGPVDFRREPQNNLGKLTNPNTGWSYHGARWEQPQAARWTAPDPAVKQVEEKQLHSPWDFNPYAYVRQNPQQYWDPDGRFPVRAGVPGFFTRIKEVFNPKLSSHEFITKTALQFTFGHDALEQVVDANVAEDKFQDSDPDSMSRHGMGNSEQDPLDAMARNTNRIEGHVQGTVTNILSGNVKEARKEFGAATHNLQDTYAPAHRKNGVPQDWKGARTPIKSAEHLSSDLSQKIDQGPAVQAAEATRDLADEVRERVQIQGREQGMDEQAIQNSLDNFFAY